MCYNLDGDIMLLIDKARELIKNQEANRHGNSRQCYFVTIDGVEYALLVYKCLDEEKNNIRLQAINDLCEQGLSTPHAIGIDYDNGVAYELQERVQGKTMAYRNPGDAKGEDNFWADFLYTLRILDNAPKDVFLRLLRDNRIMYINGYSLDCHPDNYLIDKYGNITLIDLDIYDEPKKRLDNFGLYCNILPYILSFVVYMHLKKDSKYYNECYELLRRIGQKWFEICIEYLSLLDLTFEEVQKCVKGISFNYFLISEVEKIKMIDDYFKDDRIILS